MTENLVSVHRPEHGAERNRHTHREGDTVHFKNATTGDKYEISYCSSELTVAEKFCTNCDAWVSTKPMGILGFAWCPECRTRW